MRIRSYFSKPKGIREQKCLGNTALEKSSTPAAKTSNLTQSPLRIYACIIQSSVFLWNILYALYNLAICSSKLLRNVGNHLRVGNHRNDVINNSHTQNYNLISICCTVLSSTSNKNMILDSTIICKSRRGCTTILELVATVPVLWQQLTELHTVSLIEHSAHLLSTRSTDRNSTTRIQRCCYIIIPCR